MKVLGPALITASQQDKLVEGAQLNIERKATYQTAARRAKLGDKFWVREPYIDYVPKKHGAPQSLRAMAFGHTPTRIVVPKIVRPFLAGFQQVRRDGSDLNRAQSRASLEIIEIMAEGALWKCIVHMGNVDSACEVAA